MFNMILAYAVALAMLTGAGSVPAVPETAGRTVVENIVISCGDESVALDHIFEWTRAIGSSEAAWAFDITKDGSSMLPLKAKITQEELLFSLVENGGVYSISEAFASGYIAEEADIDTLTEELEIIKSLPEIFSTGWHMTFAQELYDAVAAHEAAEALETDDAMTAGVSLYLENGAAYAFFDQMAESDTTHLSLYMQWGLDIINFVEYAEYASHAESYNGTDSYYSFTLYKTTDAAGDIGYDFEILSKDDDGRYITNMAFLPDSFAVSEKPQDTENALDGSLEFSCNMDGGKIIDACFSFGYTDEEDNTYGEEEEYVDTYAEDVFMRYDYALNGGLASRDFALELLMENSYKEDGEEYYGDSTEISLTYTANDRTDENGGIITGVQAAYAGAFGYYGEEPMETSLQAAFDIRREEIPYTDAFAGAEITPFESEEDIPVSLMGDVIVLGSRMSLLIYDDQFNDVIEMIERSVEENISSSYEIETEDLTGKESAAASVKDRSEEKYSAKSENTARGAKTEANIQEEEDTSFDMKYKNREKNAFGSATGQEKAIEGLFT